MSRIIGLIRISKDKESIWNTNRFKRYSVGLWDILDFFFIARISWETFHSLGKWLNRLRLMIFFQVVLGSFNLSFSQVLLKEIMSVISVRNYKTLLILTNDAFSCKVVIMLFTMMMVMIFMVGRLTSMVTVLVMRMILLSWMLCWFAWIFQRCWLPTVAGKRNHSCNLFFQSRKLCIRNEMIVISVRNRYATWCSAWNLSWVKNQAIRFCITLITWKCIELLQ